MQTLILSGLGSSCFSEHSERTVIENVDAEILAGSRVPPRVQKCKSSTRRSAASPTSRRLLSLAIACSEGNRAHSRILWTRRGKMLAYFSAPKVTPLAAFRGWHLPRPGRCPRPSTNSQFLAERAHILRWMYSLSR